ncbi:MAG: ribosome biogenesis GTPase Der, partial [Lachnospiraceae bacterium]|nr:ribosome biogenesis GTPase Der [Lachnospiraceae bacterium]
SAASMLGFGDMLDRVTELIPNNASADEEDTRPKVAIVGKPNVGKSSIVNRLLGEERVIVSDIAGTTRDAVDTSVKYNGKEYVFIDTAGLRRKAKVRENLERYSIVRTVGAVERADVCVIVIDAVEGISEQDAKIAGIAHNEGKGLIIAVNKWDAVEKDNSSVNKYTEDIRNVLSFTPYAEIIFISAVTGQRLTKLYEAVDKVIENQNIRIGTGVLNEIVSEAVSLQQPPTDKGRRLKIFYATQVSVKPPTFVIFVNDKKLMHYSYVRYLENKIREAFGFSGTPLRFIIRERDENKQ